MHTSGRNSGVLHAGTHKSKTLKARVCVEGAKRLKTWIEERNLPINSCGKIIVPTKQDLDGQLDELLVRGQLNGAHVELLSEGDLLKKAPEVRSASGRALWSPNTAVVKPLSVVQALQKELADKGVCFKLNEKSWKHLPDSRQISLDSSNIGCAIYSLRLHADHIAHQF